VPIAFGNQTCRISASAGTVLSLAFSVQRAAVLLHAADLALYAAKHAGRACHRFYHRDMQDDETTDADVPADEQGNNGKAATRPTENGPLAAHPASAASRALRPPAGAA